MVKVLGLPLLVLLVISAIALPVTYISYITWGTTSKQKFYFGVSYGGNTTAGAELLINKVKSYTNLFVIDSWPISTNETALNEVSNYAANANLNFIVYFAYVSTRIYNWTQGWIENAPRLWGDKFLGIYLYDEPGGKQVDNGRYDGEPYRNFTSPTEVANAFHRLGTRFNITDFGKKGIEVFTSDYALYWYDYQAGYDGVFVQLGWNNSRTQQIALCRGAANSMGKPWGAIITWTYMQTPYIASGTQIFTDMVTAYNAGAKYIIVFDYPTYPEDNPYGILQEEHFSAMKQFWNQIQTFDKSTEKIAAQVALVLPQNYGGGLRREGDNVWGPMNLTWRSTWPEDTQSSLIWQNLNTLSNKYGLQLNVVFDGNETINFAKQYSKIYLWNETIR